MAMIAVSLRDENGALVAKMFELITLERDWEMLMESNRLQGEDVMDPLACDAALNADGCSQAMIFAHRQFSVTSEVEMSKVMNVACGAERFWTPADRLSEKTVFKQSGLYFPHLSEETRIRMRDILCLV